MEARLKMSVLENALVILFDGHRAYYAYTDSSGKVTFPNVIAGTYKVVVVKENYLHAYGEVEVTEDKTLSFTLSKPLGMIERVDGVAKYELNLLKGNMFLEFFNPFTTGTPSKDVYVRSPTFYTYPKTPLILTKEGVNTKFQSVVSIQALEINISINNAIMLEVIN